VWEGADRIHDILIREARVDYRFKDKDWVFGFSVPLCAVRKKNRTGTFLFRFRGSVLLCFVLHIYTRMGWDVEGLSDAMEIFRSDDNLTSDGL